MTTEDRHPARPTPATALRRAAMALAVAYLLVLQAILGGMAGGAHAAAGIALDPFGQVICANSAGGPTSPADPAHHAPDCCTTGCQTSAGAGLPPPVAAAPALPVGQALGRAPLPRARVLALQPERTPRHTRAPPLA
ncbi:hypothetical protein MWN33_16415 [Starkeya koreensis]|uniref:DUF2946 domain-containing protein n=1 Tax=Ancylobacter koreensis TaxID=266121 RepID=A0ABT0DQQ5_9HYPH|nr:hypothetical protein [Ancylobacter koreensis]MCK0209617.1 hypothetical protein [Ancylobacter koreensis]